MARVRPNGHSYLRRMPSTDVRVHLLQGNAHLRRRLVMLDALALSGAWAPTVLWVWPLPTRVLGSAMVATMVGCGVALTAAHGLYRARIAAGREEEMRRIVRIGVELAAVHMLLLVMLGRPIGLLQAAVGPVATVVLLLWCRGGYRAWLSAARARGYYQRRVVILGTCADAAELVAMLTDHPEAGYVVSGVVGVYPTSEFPDLAERYLGPLDDLDRVLERLHIDGVIAVAGSAPSKVLAPMLARLEADGVHVQYSNGLIGTSARRIRATPVAFQALYYLEPPCGIASPRLVVKRMVDLALASLALVVGAPLMLGIALAIKFTDGGPVFFRQERVGRHGTLFPMVKFRSMVVDAEAKRGQLEAANERNGPLFKIDHDPRVTRIGRFLRATSFDELPQLFNVLRGEMAIVGPRPALASEVSQFDERLLDRLKVRPGMTGLWQVEARDNPHFGAYRRLDLFYVDNWSLNLDLVIVVATIDQLLARTLQHTRGGLVQREESGVGVIA